MDTAKFAALAVRAVQLNEKLTGKASVHVDTVLIQTDQDFKYGKVDDGWPEIINTSDPFPVIFLAGEVIFRRNSWIIEGPWVTELPVLVEAKVKELRATVTEREAENAREKAEEQRVAIEQARLEREKVNAKLREAWNS